jgi:hypothetical protein
MKPHERMQGDDPRRVGEVHALAEENLASRAGRPLCLIK